MSGFVLLMRPPPVWEVSLCPGRVRNLATEDLLYLLHGMGFETGVDWTRCSPHRLSLHLYWVGSRPEGSFAPLNPERIRSEVFLQTEREDGRRVP